MSYDKSLLKFKESEYPSLRIKVKILKDWKKFGGDDKWPNNKPWKRTWAEFERDNPDCSSFMRSKQDKAKRQFVRETIKKGWPPKPAQKELSASKRMEVFTGINSNSSIKETTKLLNKYSPTNANNNNRKGKDKRNRTHYQFIQREKERYNINQKCKDKNDDEDEEEDIDLDIFQNQESKEEDNGYDSDESIVKKWYDYNAKCHYCGGRMSSGYWPTQCCVDGCNHRYHYCCINPNELSPDDLYCNTHWMKQVGTHKPPKSITGMSIVIM